MAKDKKKQTKAEQNMVIHLGRISARGRYFEGTVVKKVHSRAVIEFERTLYIKKYERFYKKKTRIHSRIPKDMEINIGDYVLIQECRPLSKIINSIIIKKIRSAVNAQINDKEKKEK